MIKKMAKMMPKEIKKMAKMMPKKIKKMAKKKKKKKKRKRRRKRRPRKNGPGWISRPEFQAGFLGHPSGLEQETRPRPDFQAGFLGYLPSLEKRPRLVFLRTSRPDFLRAQNQPQNPARPDFPGRLSCASKRGIFPCNSPTYSPLLYIDPFVQI